MAQEHGHNSSNTGSASLDTTAPGRIQKLGKKWWKLAILILVLVLAAAGVVFIYDRFLREDTGKGEMEPWEEDLVAVMRSYEVEWDEDDVEIWQEWKTMPLELSLDYAFYQLPRFEYNHIVMKVGEENIYTQDFSYRLFVHHNKIFTSGAEISDEVLLDIAEEIIEGSVILQKGEDEGYNVLSEDVFNAVYKDYEARNILIYSILDSVPEQEVSGEAIYAWFHNATAPEIGVSAAREYAEEIISDLHERISSEEITMEEAGDILRNDSGMRSIDPGLEGNAYRKFVISGETTAFYDPDVQKAVLSLGEGQVSDVILGQDKDKEEEEYDAYFVIVYVDDRKNAGYSYEEWYADALQRYEITINPE